MNCAFFQDRIDKFADGSLSQAEQSMLEEHLAGCAHCQVVVDLFGQDQPVDAFDELTDSILEATSGSVCPSVEPQLAERADGTLPPTALALVERHLERCESCSQVARTLARYEPALSRLAAFDEDEALIQRILNDTVHARSWADRWTVRVTTWWADWQRRPRFAYEVSYALTLFLVFLTATPVSPLKGLPGEIRASLQRDEGSQPAGLHKIADSAAVEKSKNVVTRAFNDVTERASQASRAWPGLKTDTRDLFGGMFDRDGARIGGALSGLAEDFKLLWRGLRKQLPAEESDDEDTVSQG